MTRSARLALAGLALCAAPDIAVGPALAFDCAKARLPLERAICADPAAKAGDDAMVAAFERLRAGLDGPERAAALDDQRAWLKARNTACAGEAKPAACIAERNVRRVATLTGRPESGPGLDPSPRPVFVRQAGNQTRIGIALQLYRFAEPRMPGERALNAEADRVVAGTERVKPEADERDWSRDETWSIAYASPTFVSIAREAWEYSGGAHGSDSTGGLNIDMRAGRILAFADLFDAPGAAELAKLCLAQVRTEKKERGADEGDAFDVPKGVREVVSNLANWTFGADAADIRFDRYSVGSYAEGPYACTLPLATVNRYAKRALPLR